MGRILVFDVDGTLTPARLSISAETSAFLAKVRRSGTPLAVVGGSDLAKICEQLADHDLNKLHSSFDYVFAENGVVGFKGTEALPVHKISARLGEDKLQELINFVLAYFSTVTLPVKRGNFVEFRNGMINFSPIGRSCSQQERNEFVVYDAEHKIREKFVAELQQRFGQYGLTFAIGGQISVDAYPTGWDKTFCLQYLEKEYDEIHFFGDKTQPGGNDHDIFIDKRVIGHAVTDPSDTQRQIQDLLGLH